MTCMGFFNSYVQRRDTLYDSVWRRRERLRGMQMSEEARDQIEAILDDIGELKLALATVINMLVNGQVLDEDALLEQAKIIDAMDGKADGQFSGRVEPDGTVAPDRRRRRTDLDDLADAVDREQRNALQ